MNSTGQKISQKVTLPGCYGCGGWPVGFGGIVWPELRVGDYFNPRSALWWTDCPKCGRIEVEE